MLYKRVINGVLQGMQSSKGVIIKNLPFDLGKFSLRLNASDTPGARDTKYRVTRLSILPFLNSTGILFSTDQFLQVEF